MLLTDIYEILNIIVFVFLDYDGSSISRNHFRDHGQGVNLSLAITRPPHLAIATEKSPSVRMALLVS